MSPEQLISDKNVASPAFERHHTMHELTELEGLILCSEKEACKYSLHELNWSEIDSIRSPIR